VLLNALAPTEVTFDAVPEIVVNFVLPSKAWLPIFTKVEGKLTSDKAVNPEKE
jgi:hypothetical protein